MSLNARVVALIAISSITAVAASLADERQAYSGSGCAVIVDDFFANDVWAGVGAQSCLKCHKAGGDAEDSDFVLEDPQRSLGHSRDEVLQRNLQAFAEMARRKRGDQSRLLLKAIGKLHHGGKESLSPDSAGYRILARFVHRLDAPAATSQPVAEDKNAPPFFDGIVMLDDRALLRRVALSLAARLPTDAETAAVTSQGPKAIPALLDAMMREEAFYTRLREGFNDIFLTVGLLDNAETALSYEHFEKTRNWPEKFDLSQIADPQARQRAGWKMFDVYRGALLGEPMKLVEHIVRNDRPFTEIVTADYIMVTPYTARGYGIFDDVKSQFKNPDDPFEYFPAKLKALKGRSHEEDQDSATGFYPHAGLLTTFQYLRRYPTTETNRNRLRARMFYQQFLGVDVLELAARVTDAAAITARFKVPTMQASECIVCHKTVDPVAGLFQDYWRFDAVYGKRKEGWFKDMFAAGFEGEELPDNERWRSLQWLGERTARDPRFAVAMVEHVYYILTGRKVLKPPKDLEDPLFAAKRRAYQEQRKQVESIAVRFSQNGFNLKNVFKEWVLSDFYRADGLAAAASDPGRQAELDDVGLVRMLAPEQIERKVTAIFGQPWGRMDEQLAMLYGGIDSREVTERAADPSGAMGAIQRLLADDVACRQTALDFTRAQVDRKLFPNIEPDVIPGSSPQADEKIHQAIAYLHERVLGRHDAPDSPEVERTYRLFAGIVADAAERKDIDPRETYWCGHDLPVDRPPDPRYTIRAWRAVVTYPTAAPGISL